MPEKLGNGGHGPENYDPNTGKYETDGQPNKSYDNPEEEKIIEQTKEFESKVNCDDIQKRWALNKAFFKGNSYVREIALSPGMLEEIRIVYGPEEHTCFDKYDMAVIIHAKAFNSDMPLEQTMWHEIFHSFDSARGVELTATLTLKNGKTLKEIVSEEMNEIDAEKICEEYKSTVMDEIYKVAGVTPKEIQELSSIIAQRTQEEEKFGNKWLDLMGEGKFEEANRLKEENQAFYEKTQELTDQLKSMNKKMEQCLHETILGNAGEYYMEVVKSSAAISDFISGVTDNRLNLNFGHSDQYWNQGFNTKEGIIASELFANYGSLKATNDTRGLNLIKKYLPKSFEGLEELYGSLKGIADEIKEFRETYGE